MDETRCPFCGGKNDEHVENCPANPKHLLDASSQAVNEQLEKKRKEKGQQPKDEKKK